MPDPLRISFYGSSLVSAYWNGAATYYRGIIRALAALGHEVTFYEPDAFGRQQHRDMADPDWARVVVYGGEDEADAVAALDAGADADVLVKASGVGVFDAFLEREVVHRRRPGQTVIFWDVDAPATLQRLADTPDDPFHDLVGAYDLVLTYGGGEPVRQAYEAIGAQRCVPVYNALDPDEHFPVEPDPAFACDLAFLGNRLPDREARVDEFFFKPAAALPNRRFLIGGNGWHDRDLPPNVRALGHVYTARHNAFNCTPRAVLNISRQSMATIGFSPATRVFEAAGAGACLVTDRWKGIELFLEPDEEVLVASDGDEVAAQLEGLDEQRAADIGRAARQRILREHTYTHRAAQVSQLLAEHRRREPQEVTSS